jgi:excisionase family DNA binding protein
MSDTTGDTSHNTTDVSHDTTVDVTTAAERLGISEEAVRARIRRGKLAAVKVGALWRVHLPEGEPVVAPNTTVPLRDTTSRHTTERVAQHDTPPRNMDLEPLAAVIRDQNHRIEELAAAAAFWQVRAQQAEEQLKQLAAGTPEPAEDAPEMPDLTPGSTQTNETAPTGIWIWLKRIWNG